MYSAIVSAVFLGCSLFCTPVRPQASCKKVKQINPSSGVRNITLVSEIVSAYCDQTTDGGGWTVIQRRQNGSVDFDRGWHDYVNGFGDLENDFWFGLKNIYHLALGPSYATLRVDMWAYDGTSAYAKYNYFWLGGAVDEYRLFVFQYSGTAGDSLEPHNRKFFSTFDKNAAWWRAHINYANLNGIYYRERFPWRENGIFWWHYRGRESLWKTEMKIRQNSGS